MDPSIVFVADTQAFNMYLLTIPDQVNISIDSLKHYISLHLKDREVLEKYRYQPFLYYEKLKAILHCIESTALGPSPRGALSGVECQSAIVSPNQRLRSFSSDPFIYSDSATSSAAMASFPSCLLADHQSFPSSSSGSSIPFPPWSPQRKVSGSNQYWALDNQPASSLSIHSSSTLAIQQSGQQLPAASFDASESHKGAVAVQMPAVNQPQPISALPLSRNPALLSLTHCHATPSLPSGLRSIARSSRASCKRRHVDETANFSRQSVCLAIEQSESATSSRSSPKRRRVDRASNFGDQPSCLEITPMETVAIILDSVELLGKIIRHPPPPPPPSHLIFRVLAVTKATEALSRNRSLSNEQKVLLRQHFCKNPAEAASLPQDDALLKTIFQDMVRRPDML